MFREASLTTTPTPDAVSPRQAELQKTLAEGLDRVLTTEGFQAYLRMVSRFHTYSFQNTLLILTQDPNATKVMGYGDKEGKTGWLSLGRQVRRGERGIGIFAPNKRWVTETDPETGEESRRQLVTGFRVVNVFDVSQTDGEPLPEQPKPVLYEQSDERAADVNKRLGRYLIDQGLRMESKDFEGSAAAYFSPPDNIVIRRTTSVNEDGEEHVLVDPLNIQKTKTLAHEASHWATDGILDLTREDAETIGESSAFVVMDHFGMPTDGYSFPYIATWSGGNRMVLSRNLQEIQKVSSTLITAIEGVTPDELSEPI